MKISKKRQASFFNQLFSFTLQNTETALFSDMNISF